MHLLIVSGRSGAGKSSALGALEDLNFYCIDNQPVALIQQTVSTLLTVSPGRNLAVSIDIRTLGQPADVPALVQSPPRGWMKTKLNGSGPLALIPLWRAANSQAICKGWLLGNLQQDETLMADC